MINIKKGKAPKTSNRYTSKKLKTTLGEKTIQVPWGRNSSFNPMLIKKHRSTLDGIENIVISLYTKRDGH